MLIFASKMTPVFDIDSLRPADTDKSLELYLGNGVIWIFKR
jgi:hypothetical protein